MSANGLTYLNLKTSSNPVTIQSDQDILDNAPKGAWFIAYLYHRVVIGRIENKQFVYYKQEDKDVKLNNILKLRVFNDDSELFVWKTSLGGHMARLRNDEYVKILDPIDMKNKLWFNPDKQYAVETKQVLFGTEAKPTKESQGYSVLTEKRGTEIVLPLIELGIHESAIDDKKGRLCIKTRSYIGYVEETGQASYKDVRFVKFEMYKEEKQ